MPSPIHAPPPPTDQGHPSAGQATLKVALAAVAAIAAVVVLGRGKPGAKDDTASTPVPTARAVGAPALAPSPPGPSEDGRISKEDVAFLDELSARLERSRTATPTQAELERVEKLVGANRQSAALKNLLMSLYVRRADHDLQLGSFAQVDSMLAQMKFLDDSVPMIYAFETQARAQQHDWSGTLSAVQQYESRSGDATLMMSYTLALALEKLGRRPDALAVLDRPIFQSCSQTLTSTDLSFCSAARQMRLAISLPEIATATGVNERPRETLRVDPSKEQIQSERFDVRFDGENQNGVARDVLFVLDRAYTRLADIYYDRPKRKIPVVLHSSQDYYTKTGAPWWSGGVYSSHSGSIQIPIRGLPSTLPREMEDVLVHELSHAFVDEMSGGLAGRDMQEGLAQYMEGKRMEKEMTPADLKRLANSSGQAVSLVYKNALVFAQQLVQSRGQGSVNQLLNAMKETGSEDGGFRKVYGQSREAMKREIFETFKRRYS